MSNLVVGTYIVPEVFPELGDVWAPGAKVVHIDLNAYEIGKNHPVDLGMVADPKLTLVAARGGARADAAGGEEAGRSGSARECPRRQGGEAYAPTSRPTGPCATANR